MDPSRDFAFVIMNATDQIGGIQISNEGQPHVLGFEKSSGNTNLPLQILGKNGEDCSAEYKVVECYFEVDGEKVVPVEVARVREELARSDRQKEMSGCSGSEEKTSHLNGMPDNLEIEERKCQETRESQRICSESRTFGAGALDSLRPDCSSEHSDDLHQMTFNVGSSSYTDCNPVEKMRRMEVRVEDFRLLNAKKDGSCCEKDAAEEENSEMLKSEQLLFDLETETLPRITRSQAKNDDDAVPRRSGRLQRDDGIDKKPDTNKRRMSTGKLIVDSTNHELGQQRNSFPGFNKETKPEIVPEATAKKKNLRKSHNLQSVQSPEIKEVNSTILEGTVQPNIVQKRPVGRPRKVVANSKDGEALIKDSEKNSQQKEESEVTTNKLLKQGEGGLNLENQDVLKTDESVKGFVEDQQGTAAEQKSLATVKPFVEDLEKLDLPVVQKHKHEESLVAVETFGENASGQTATANELLSKSQNSLSQKLHKGSQNSAAVDWDEESQSSYDVLLLKELSESESKQVSDVDDPNDEAVLDTKQAPQKRIFELLAEIRQLTNKNAEHVASDNTSASELFARMTGITEKELLESSVKAELDKVAALQKELNIRAQTLNSREAELLARKTRLKDLQQAYDIEDAKNALEREQLANARAEVAEERRKIAADHEELRSGKYRRKAATPMKPLTTGKNLVKKTAVQCYRKRPSEEAKLQSSTNPQEASVIHSSTTPEIVARVTTETHNASSMSQSSSVALVPQSMASAASSPLDDSFNMASTTEISPSSVSSLETSENPLGSCLPLKAVCLTTSSSEFPSYHPSTSIPSPKRDIPLSFSFRPDAETASSPPASSNIPSSSLSSSNVDASTALPSNVETLSSFCLSNETYLPSSASEVEMLLPSSLVETEVLPPSLPSGTELVRPSSSASSVSETVQPVSSSSVAEILPSVSSSSLIEILPSASSFSLAETLTSVSSSSVVEIPSPVSSSSVAEILPSVSSSSVAEILPSVSSSSVAEILPSVSSSSVAEIPSPVSSSSVTEIIPSVSSSSLIEILPLASSFALAEMLTSVSSSSVVEILPPVSSPSLAETLPLASPAVAETLPSTSSPLKTETLPSTSTSLPSGIETRSPTKAINSSPSTPSSSSKCTPCRSSSISCSNISPTCRHLFSKSVCMLPSVTLVPVTAPYVLHSRINHPSATDLEKSSPSRLSRKRVAANGNSSKSKKISKH